MSKSKYTVILKEPYTFEGKEYQTIDLTKLETVSTAQLCKISKRFSTTSYINPRPEADMEYCIMLAAEVSGLPEDFFLHLPGYAGIQVRDCVQGFFQIGAGTD